MNIRFMNQLNPFCKALAILIAGLLLTFSYLVTLNAIVCAVCLILLLVFSRFRLRTMIGLLIPALLAAISLFMTGLLHANSSAGADLTATENFQVAMNASLSFYNALQLGTRVLAFAMLGILFALTTDAELFIQSLMHQCHLPPQFAYGTLAAFHLMPHIREEYHNAGLAYRARGIGAGRLSLQPLFTAMVSCIRWSENVAMAMESKGFDGDGPRTYYQVTTVGLPDYLFLILLNTAILAGLLLFPY